MNEKPTETPVTNPQPAVAPVTPTATAKTQPVSAFSLISKSWEAVQRNIVVFGILFIPTAISTILGLVSNKGSEKSYTAAFNSIGNGSTASLAGFVGGIAAVGLLFFAVGVVVQALSVVAQLRASEGKTVSFGQVWDEGKSYIFRILGLSIVTGLLIVLGFICLIVPGVIALRRYFLAPYLLVDKNLGIGEAMKQSAAISKPFSGSIYGVIGVTILLSLTGIIPVVGSIIGALAGVVYSVAPALRYQELKNVT